MKISQKGFSLVELIIISPIIIFSIGYTMGFLIDLYLNTNEMVTKLNLKSDAQNLLYRMQDDLFFASEFAGAMPTDTADNYQKNDNDGSTNWSTGLATAMNWQVDNGAIAVGSHALLISNEPATDKKPTDLTRQLIYKIPTAGGGCGIGYFDYPLLLDTSVYYAEKLADGTARLYRRVATQSAPNGTCPKDGSGNDLVSYQRTTYPNCCGAAASPKDSLVSSKLYRVEVTLYNKDDTAATTFTEATKARIKVTLRDTVNAKPVYESSELTLKKAN